MRNGNLFKFYVCEMRVNKLELTKELVLHGINGPIFLRRFKLYMFSFTFGFMFANISFEKNQNSKIYVMFIINIT